MKVREISMTDFTLLAEAIFKAALIIMGLECSSARGAFTISAAIFSHQRPQSLSHSRRPREQRLTISRTKSTIVAITKIASISPLRPVAFLSLCHIIAPHNTAARCPQPHQGLMPQQMVPVQRNTEIITKGIKIASTHSNKRPPCYGYGDARPRLSTRSWA